METGNVDFGGSVNALVDFDLVQDKILEKCLTNPIDLEYIDTNFVRIKF